MELVRTLRFVSCLTLTLQIAWMSYNIGKMQQKSTQKSRDDVAGLLIFLIIAKWKIKKKIRQSLCLHLYKCKYNKIRNCDWIYCYIIMKMRIIFCSCFHFIANMLRSWYLMANKNDAFSYNFIIFLFIFITAGLSLGIYIDSLHCVSYLIRILCKSSWASRIKKQEKSYFL